MHIAKSLVVALASSAAAQNTTFTSVAGIATEGYPTGSAPRNPRAKAGSAPQVTNPPKARECGDTNSEGVAAAGAAGAIAAIMGCGLSALATPRDSHWAVGLSACAAGAVVAADGPVLGAVELNRANCPSPDSSGGQTSLGAGMALNAVAGGLTAAGAYATVIGLLGELRRPAAPVVAPAVPDQSNSVQLGVIGTGAAPAVAASAVRAGGLRGRARGYAGTLWQAAPAAFITGAGIVGTAALADGPFVGAYMLLKNNKSGKSSKEATPA